MGPVRSDVVARAAFARAPPAPAPHTDADTGVGKWWKPFDVSYEFKYTGLDKSKGQESPKVKN